MKKIYCTNRYIIEDTPIKEATVVKETEKTYTVIIDGDGNHERTIRKSEMTNGYLTKYYFSRNIPTRLCG